MSAERIELHRSNFPSGTLGIMTFPDILEGRIRHQAVFDRPYSQLITLSIHQTNILQRLGVETLSDLLNMPLQDLRNQTRFWGLIKYELLDYLRDSLSVGPEGFLLKAVFTRGESIPLPVKFEGDRELAVVSALATLEKRQQDVLEKRFGIADGKMRTLEQVRSGLGIGTRERVRELERRGLRNLRHPSRSTNLSLYAPLPKDNLVKELWPADFTYQINQLISPLDLRKITAEDIYSSEYLRAEFPTAWRTWRNYSQIPLTLVMHLHASELEEIVAQEFRKVFQILKDRSK